MGGDTVSSAPIPPRGVLGGKVKYAFIEGPDKLRIELVEGHAKKE